MVVHFWGVIYVILFILGINSLDMACTIVEFLDIFAYLTTFKIILFRFNSFWHSTYHKKKKINFITNIFGSQPIKIHLFMVSLSTTILQFPSSQWV